MQVMYPARSRMPFCSNEILALVRTSGKHKQGSGPSIDCRSNGRAHQGQQVGMEVAAEGFKGPGLGSSNEGQDEE